MTTQPTPITESEIAELEEAYRNGRDDATYAAFPRLAAAAREGLKLREAARLRITDWDNVSQPGAAADGCPDPDDVKAFREALKEGA